MKEKATNKEKGSESLEKSTKTITIGDGYNKICDGYNKPPVLHLPDNIKPHPTPPPPRKK
jgi:hypothetical protein